MADVTVNFTRAIVYPEAKITAILCPSCLWRFMYAITETDRMVRCRHCGRHYLLKDLRSMILDVVDDTGITLSDIATGLAADALEKVKAARGEYRKGVS